MLRPAAVEGAMEEMVFLGGELNLKLLGGPATGAAATPQP